MPVFKLQATVYVQGKTSDCVSSELHDILRHAVNNYSAFVAYDVQTCDQLDDDHEEEIEIATQ